MAVVRTPSTCPSTDHPAARRPLVVVIEGVEKPGNVGAVLRSADGAGADAVIAASPRTDLANPNVIRASAGTIFAVPMAAAPTADARLAAERRESASSPPGSMPGAPYTDADLTGPVAIVLGAEAEGLSDAWRAPGHRGHPPADARRRRQPQRLGHAPPSSCTRRADSATVIRPVQTDAMSTSFDFVVIGAGPAGEAAANKARELGATVAIVDERWFGGSCPHVGCIRRSRCSHGAHEHAKNPAAYDWPRASARRDYMVNRAADAAEPDDAGHVTALEKAGAVVYRGEGRITGRGRSRSGTTASATSSRPAQRRRRRRVASRSADRHPGHDGRRPWTQRGGDADPGAAAEPARPRRRPDRLRARPGLRPVRGPDDDRPVRAAAGPDRPPAQLRGHPRDARGGRRHGPDRRRAPSAPAPAPGPTART